MKFVFWQDIISIHQSAFLSALSKQHQVVLIAENEIENDRKSHGWNIPSLGKTKFIGSPTDSDIKCCIENNLDAIHVFSGINTIPMVYRAFRYTKFKKVKRIVFMEPYNFIGIKGFIRRIKYTLLLYRYRKAIDVFMPTGELGIKCYSKTGFPNLNMFQWGYFTEQKKINFANYIKNKPSLLFIGSIDKRKNILKLTETCKKLKDRFEQFTIIGTGPLEEDLNLIIKDYPNIVYIGSIPNTNVYNYLQKYDILVLPSRFDGWGAVTNEALFAGTPVIASENCGSGVLLDGKVRGEVFSFSGKNNLSFVIRKWLKKGPLTKEERIQISEWSQKNISGNAAAKYFIDIIEYIENKKLPKPNAPWL